MCAAAAENIFTRQDTDHKEAYKLRTGEAAWYLLKAGSPSNYLEPTFGSVDELLQMLSSGSRSTTPNITGTGESTERAVKPESVVEKDRAHHLLSLPLIRVATASHLTHAAPAHWQR
jgi:hypothetical protein